MNPFKRVFLTEAIEQVDCLMALCEKYGGDRRNSGLYRQIACTLRTLLVGSSGRGVG